MKNADIAPCGMNCGTCIAYQRDKNTCPGCRKMGAYSSSYCRNCIIRNCHVLENKNIKFCSYACDKYPCTKLKNLDKRYRTKYGMSMIENLENLKYLGIRKFVKNEQTRWKCHKCGRNLCVHRDTCLKCGEKR